MKTAFQSEIKYNMQFFWYFKQSYLIYFRIRTVIAVIFTHDLCDMKSEWNQ